MAVKSLLPLGVLALVLGSLVAALPLRQNFSLLESYEFKAEIVYVYLRLFEVDPNASGLWRMPMLSYVMVLNVTNPTAKTIRMRDTDFNLATSVEPHNYSQGIGVTILNSIVMGYRYFPQDHISYFWYPNSSKSMVFSGVKEFSFYGDPNLMQKTFDSFLEMRGRTPEGAYASTGYVIKKIKLETVSSSEYVYNIMPGKPRFHFGDEPDSISFEWSNRTVSP